MGRVSEPYADRDKSSFFNFLSDCVYIFGLWSPLRSRLMLFDSKGRLFEVLFLNFFLVHAKTFLDFNCFFRILFTFFQGRLHDVAQDFDYDGRFKDGKFHGQGTLNENDGAVIYKGGFANGLKHGMGKLK